MSMSISLLKFSEYFFQKKNLATFVARFDCLFSQTDALKDFVHAFGVIDRIEEFVDFVLA